MNAAEAWHAFSTAPQQFDLLITDHCMPGMSGDMLAQDCRRLRPDLPVILCTGSDHALPAADARAHGVTEYLLKPLLLHDVAHAIRRVLDGRDGSGPPRQTQGDATLLGEESDAVGTRR
jgi:DNA-binding NtrC family response regulator